MIIRTVGISNTMVRLDSWMVQQLCCSTKPNEKVWLCLDPGRLYQVLIWLVHREPTLNDILPKLGNACYINTIYASSGYHNLQIDRKFYICMSVWQALVHQSTLWSSTTRWHVPEENWWNIWRPMTHIWHSRWHSHCKAWCWWHGVWQNPWDWWCTYAIEQTLS